MDPLLLLLEAVARRFAREVHLNGVRHITHDGDPALAAVFERLGWGNAYPIEPLPVVDAEPAVDAEPIADDTRVMEAATVTAPERAVMPKAKGRVG